MAAIAAGSSIVVFGELGIGKGEFAQALARRFGADCAVAVAAYKGSLKKLLIELAAQLDIPTGVPKLDREGNETGEEKAMTADQLKEEIALNVGARTLLILKDANRLPASIRYWLEGLLESDVRLALFAIANPNKDIFARLIEIELAHPPEQEIRRVMEQEAARLGLQLSRSRLAELLSLAGRNLMLARKVVREEALGFKQRHPKHTQYVVIMPIVLAGLMSFGIIRFIGMGTRNRGLYITGGVCLVAAMALKQLGQVRGARKRLGQ